MVANYKKLVNPVRGPRQGRGRRLRCLAYNRVKYFPKYNQKKLPREVALIEISKKTSQELNRRYRKKNKSTNVLSFRYGPEYGEILLCPEIIKKEAKAQGNTYKYQMTWMVVHGMMHLGGFHHEKGAAEKAEKLEERILAKMF